MATVFTEKTASAESVTERTTPENEGAGYAIVMGIVVPTGGGPGGVTRRTVADSAPLTEQTANADSLTEKETT